MKKEDVLKAIKLRIKYLEIVGNNPKTMSDIQQDIGPMVESIMQFSDMKDKKEFDKELIELCAQVILYVSCGYQNGGFITADVIKKMENDLLFPK